jgi:multiple sugar transport system substrate-binding protein
MATRDSASGLKRRAFLTMAGAAAGAATVGGIPGILLAQKPPSFPKGTKLHLLEWVSFVPAADVELKRLAEEFGKLAGVDVTVELINFNDLNPRIASGIETKAGPDIIQMHGNWPHLYADGLNDVDALAEEIDKRDGGVYDLFRSGTFVGNRWKAVPMGTSPPTFAYRTDWFKEVGVAKFPDTMDEFRKVGTELKKKNRPIGQAFGHSLGDPNGWAYAITWCFGGQEVDKEQKTVLINSKETIEALKFTVAMWKDALDEGGLAWDDTSNNRAYLAGTISATLNGASIYFVGKRQFPDIAKVTDHGHMPKGPGGRFYSMGPQSRAIMKYSKNQDVAAAFIRWLMDRPVRQVHHGERRLPHRPDPVLGEARALGEGPQAGALQGGDQVRPLGRLAWPAEPEGVRGARQVHHGRHVRPGHQGHETRGRRQVGRGRTEEGVRVA